MGTVAGLVGCVALALVFVPQGKAWASGLGFVAVIVSLIAQTSTGWIGAAFGIIAIVLRVVFQKPKGEPTQSSQPKPA